VNGSLLVGRSRRAISLVGACIDWLDSGSRSVVVMAIEG
jgi:hypothetical protein